MQSQTIQSTKAKNSTLQSKIVDDLSPASLPFGISFHQMLGTGATPEQLADALIVVTGTRIRPGVLQLGLREAERQADALGEMADTIGCLERSSFPALEKAPSTLLARLIQNKEVREYKEMRQTGEYAEAAR